MVAETLRPGRAHVLVGKDADHLPLYRQAQIFDRQGLALDRSTLADWGGHAARELRPVHARLVEILKASPRLFADETRAPVLDPGRGRTKTGWLWALARDGEPWRRHRFELDGERPGAAPTRRASPSSMPRGAAPNTPAVTSSASAARCRSTAMPPIAA